VSFRVLCADPPWRYGDKLPGKGRGAGKHYDEMPVRDICRFPLPDMERDSLLLLWRVAAQQEEALQVVRMWGFVPKSEIVWQKLTRKAGKKHFGMGRVVRASHETCIVATRGRFKPLVKNIRSTFEAPVGIHSEKPEFFYREIVEKLAEGPYCELFARRLRDGWTCLGNELPT
jgi:site-specific DNA-methyltransferase (adenine-specific)